MRLTFTGKNNIWNCLYSSLAGVLFSSGVLAQNPLSSFTTNVTSGCAPLTVYFTNTSTQANSYFWNFGNGNTSTLNNPSAVYVSPGSYIASLIAINTITNQRDTFSLNITVVPDPVSGFTATPQTSCAGTTAVQFTNLSVGATNYLWDFGDGNSSSATNPLHIYTTPGNYTVKLIADNNFGCPDLHIKNNYIHIRAVPVAQFTSNLTSSCNVNTAFNFTCTTAGATTFYWNFGDGATSVLSNPTHTYGAAGAYTITLIVSDSFGCSDTLVSTNYINIGPNLVPSFTVNSTKGCAPFNCIFTNTNPGGTSWFWDFGDGTTSSQPNPSHLYANPGNYTIILTVTTTNGCNGTVTLTNYIQVDALPVANFTTIQDSGCIPFTVPFTNTSTGSVSWIWDFGNGTGSILENPSATYSTVGNYTVTLHAFSVNGCENIFSITNAVVTKKATASFNASNNIGCPPLTTTFNSNASTGNIVSWYWDFGDGTTSTLQNPAHVFTTIGNYSIKLIVTSSLGCIDTLLRYNYVKVVSGVTNYTTPDTILLCQPGVINCVDPTFGSNSWSWNFGDGGTSNIKNPIHTYLNPGTYTITLTNNMPGGCNQVFNPYAIVQVFPVSLVPISAINVSPCQPYVVALNNATPGVGTYLWNFGDGTTSTLQNPNHTYANAGTYTITLTLVMQSGCTTAMSETITVGHPNPIAVNTTMFCLGDPTLFSITNPAAFVSYIWDFGDGGSSTQTNPAYTYAAPGAYMVSVTTTDTSGCIQVYTYPAFINVSNPLASFTVPGPTVGCSNMVVAFNNTSTNASSYFWDFGDGGTSTATNPSHLYNSPGVYTVSLSASNNGCTRTTVHTNQIIINAAQCNFMYTYSNGCLPITVNYTDLSTNAVSWSWNFGDGNTSTLKNPVHTFLTAPAANVTLTIVDIFGCSKTKSKPNINYLAANFSVSDTLTCSGANVSFTNLSSPGISWLWSFGDGTTSTNQNPVHSYAASGIYTISLVVTFSQGCSDTVTYQNLITVSPLQADFVSPTVAGCSPTQISFSNLSANATSYLWSFGDSTTSTIEMPSHIYNIPGYYSIKLIAYNNTGCSDTIEKINYIKIPGTYASFNISGLSGCEMFNAQFTDLSINAISWSWNFGDGNISNVQNPNHQYTDSGSFVVTLITEDTIGCTSFFSFPTPVIVYPNPTALASTPDTVGCQPYNASFINTSYNAVNYFWVFGDGDTSSLFEPLHTYTTPGFYSPYLVAISPNGCRDTFNIPQGITVLKTPVSVFSSNPGSGCNPATFTVSNQSSNLYLPAYNWSSGNGNFSNQPITTFTYPVAGAYQISLVVTNGNGCRDTSNLPITVFDSPVAMASTNDKVGCMPYTSTFTNQSTNATSYFWNFGDGTTDTSKNPVHSYLLSGLYTVTLIAYNNQGCSDTLILPFPVKVNQTPTANFSVNVPSGCIGSTFGLTNQSTGLVSGATFNWTISNGLTSSQQNPFITLNESGLFGVMLVVDNMNGCKDSLYNYPFIQVFDSLPPAISPLKSVSVVSDTSVKITWGVCTAPDFAAYVLSRLDYISSTYLPVLTDSNQNNGSLIYTSDYTEDGLSTLDSVYTYMIETYDLCGNVISGNKLTTHTTINVTAVAAGKNIQVSWTPYLGCSIGAYEISRLELPAGNWQLIGSVDSQTVSFLDTTLLCPLHYAYRINAINLCGEGYNAFSDTSVAKPENELADQEVQIVRSTVINNKSVLTEWLPPVLAPDRVMIYNIYRSTDSINYSFLAAVPVLSQSYIDNSVQVENQNYFYRILAINDCNVEGTNFTNSSSILIQGKWVNEKTTLTWTKYRQWDSGVNQYVIERLDANGQWKVIKVVDGTINSAILDE